MLTEADCSNARCPLEKVRLRLSDSGTLCLQVEANGSRRSFWKYTVGGGKKRISLGHYTEAGSSKVQTSLKAAREARDAARNVHRTGADLHGALRPVIVKHMAAVLEPLDVDALMRAIAEYSGQHADSCRPRVVGVGVPASGQHPPDGVA